MKILPPIAITDSLFISSTVLEDDYTAWSSATAYVPGNRVIVVSTHKVYEALRSGTNYSPPANLTGLTPYWLEIGATNRWRMLDGVIGSQTEDADEIIVAVDCSDQGHVVLLNLDATDLNIQVYDNTDLDLIMDEDINLLSNDNVVDFYSYIFAPFIYVRNLQFFIPNLLDGELTVSIFNPTGTAKCGEFMMGNTIPLGCTNFGASIGITDYSMKQVDDFGNYSVLQRSFSKRGSYDVEVDSSKLEYVFNVLSQYRSTPVLWLPTEEENFSSPTMTYGFYKDFTITLAYVSHCICNLEVEGLL